MRKQWARRPHARGVARAAAGAAIPARGLRRELPAPRQGSFAGVPAMESPHSADDHYRLGRTALEAGELQQAVEHLQSAYRLDAATPLYRSYYGLVLGLAERRLERAISLCRSAATRRVLQPGPLPQPGARAPRLRLQGRGDPLSAARADDRSGQRGDRRQRCVGMGSAQTPALGFLRRRNLLNRLLGRADPTARSCAQSRETHGRSASDAAARRSVAVSLALALVPGALQQLALLVLAHLLAPLLDDAAHVDPRLRSARIECGPAGGKPRDG